MKRIFTLSVLLISTVLFSKVAVPLKRDGELAIV